MCTPFYYIKLSTSGITKLFYENKNTESLPTRCMNEGSCYRLGENGAAHIIENGAVHVMERCEYSCSRYQKGQNATETLSLTNTRQKDAKSI
jgi:hypothetical protein